MLFREKYDVEKHVSEPKTTDRGHLFTPEKQKKLSKVSHRPEKMLLQTSFSSSNVTILPIEKWLLLSFFLEIAKVGIFLLATPSLL